MKNSLRVMMDMIKSQICQTSFDITRFLELTEAEQNELAAIAREHSVAQLLGNLLGLCPETNRLELSKKLGRDAMLALQQTARIERERKRICEVLEQEHIPFIQLKGARARAYYPEPWMRTSCDNDILVHEADVDRAAERLVEQLNYRMERKGFHDIPLFSKGGVNLELHFSIRGRSDRMNPVLDRVWDPSFAQPVPGSSEYLQSSEFFLFHIIAHMANHVLGGGCGLQPLIDLFLLRKKMDCDEAALRLLCREAGIEQFYDNASALIDVWFNGQPHTPVTRHLEEFILSGGRYGTKENQIAVSENRNGHKLSYIWGYVLLPYENMCTLYPFLRKYKVLLPFCHLHRWCRAFIEGKGKLVRQDLKATHSLNAATLSDVQKMLSENGLI